MKARYMGKTDPLILTHGNIYEVLSVEKGWYRIIPDWGEYPDADPPGYLFPPQLFEVVEGSINDVPTKE